MYWLSLFLFSLIMQKMEGQLPGLTGRFLLCIPLVWKTSNQSYSWNRILAFLFLFILMLKNLEV